MASLAQRVRIQVALEPQGLLPVFDQLAVLDLVPRRMEFRHTQGDRCLLMLELDPVAPDTLSTLLFRLEQAPAVRSVHRTDI